MEKLKSWLFRQLVNRKWGRQIINKLFKQKFESSAAYWEHRYNNNGNSGDGSYGEKAIYKANFLNRFVAENNIQHVIEFGCGDGNQLKLFNFPAYTGLDVSKKAISLCKQKFEKDTTKSFIQDDGNRHQHTLLNTPAELAISLDVIYHLVEDAVFESYMNDLFAYVTKYVIIYAWDIDDNERFHVKHRRFNNWISDHINNWELVETVRPLDTTGVCDFFIYRNVQEV